MRLKLSTGLITLVIFLSTFSNIKVSGTNSTLKPQLKFKADGTFKILQLTDIHGGPNLEKNTSTLIKIALDSEKPDFVIITGDIIDGKCKSKRDIKNTIATIASIIEKRGCPWSVTFGNHDDEHGLMSREELLEIYMSYSKNLTQPGPKDIAGVGNYNLLINDSTNTKPISNLYMMDSGNLAPTEVGGYNWIRFSQVQWYRRISTELQEKYKGIIPSLMFTHIALPEFKQSWDTGKVSGIRNENECCPKLNSGLFSSLIEMKDVLGVFVGHDHTNDYIGDLYGIKLGYCRATGHNTYGLEGFAKGARVFLLKEADTSKFDTWVVTEDDFRK